MKKIDTDKALSILANVVVIAGIVFLAYELRQNTIATQMTAAQNEPPRKSRRLQVVSQAALADS